MIRKHEEQSEIYLNSTNEQLQAENKELKAEVERYKGVVKILEKDVAIARIEAINECIDKVKQGLISKGFYPAIVNTSVEDIKKDIIETKE